MKIHNELDRSFENLSMRHKIEAALKEHPIHIPHIDQNRINARIGREILQNQGQDFEVVFGLMLTLSDIEADDNDLATNGALGHFAYLLGNVPDRERFATIDKVGFVRNSDGMYALVAYAYDATNARAGSIFYFVPTTDSNASLHEVSWDGGHPDDPLTRIKDHTVYENYLPAPETASSFLMIKELLERHGNEPGVRHVMYEERTKTF